MSKLVIFSAPSGAGKSTIVQHLLKNNPEFRLEFSISATTRAPRGEEKHGVEYYFLTTEDFKSKISNNEFVEFEEVYADNFYGTLKSEIDRISDQGNNTIFDIDVVGGVNIKKMFGDKALSIFIQPPSIEELEKRLISRATDDIDAIKRRIAKAKEEMTYSDKFDKVVVNDDLETAIEEVKNHLSEFLNIDK